MKQSIAAAPAETWNQKNLPSDIERVQGAPGKRLLRELPSAVGAFAQRRPGIIFLALAAAITALGLTWYFSQRD